MSDFENRRIPTADEIWDMYERGEFDDVDGDLDDYHD